MLPKEEIYRKLREYLNDKKLEKEVEIVVVNINNLRIQGSRAVAMNAINILERVAKEKGFGKAFGDMAEFISMLRPTQVMTYNIVEYLKKEKNMKAFDNAREFINKSRDRIRDRAIEYLEGNEIIMTHCHSSEELDVIKYAHSKGYKFKVYVTETRPKMQGIKSAKELLKEGIGVKYIVDSAAGYYIRDVDMCLFGMDAIRREGVWNKIGTYLIALAGRTHNKDIYFIGDVLKLDRRRKAYVEFRDPREIIDPKELEGAEILNPAFDYTPWDIISGAITGIKTFEKWEDTKDIDIFKLIKETKK